jgi:hypothetical protein
MEIRRTTSIPQLERRLDDLFKLAEKRGLTQAEQPRITMLTEGPRRDKALAFLGGRHWAFDPKTGATLFTLKLGTPGSVGMPANEPGDGDPPEAA